VAFNKCAAIIAVLSLGIAEHSGSKQMDTEALDLQKLHGAPPLMPWQRFAEWIGMGDEPIVVRTWIDRGYLPTEKVGKRVMVNVALLTRHLLEKEWSQ
jgi:hypothetical protein